MQDIIEIYTDGSSLGNPGKGGWGVVVTSVGKTIKELGGYEKNTTNNRMELLSVISALKYLSARQDLAEKSEIVIHADSTYVLGGVTTWIHNWEKNGWKTANKKQVLNKDLWQELIALVRSFEGKLSWQKVKGHAGHIHNERADELATQCSSLQRKHIL